jgi:hypothetical protein
MQKTHDLQSSKVDTRLLKRRKPILSLVNPLGGQVPESCHIVLKAYTDSHAELHLNYEGMARSRRGFPVFSVFFPKGWHMQDPIDGLKCPEICFEQSMNHLLGRDGLPYVEGEHSPNPALFHRSRKVLALGQEWHIPLVVVLLEFVNHASDEWKL